MANEGYVIDKMIGNGNCLFRAFAKQIYGNSEEYQKVRKETVEHIISHRSKFSAFERDMDGRLSK